MTSSRRKNKCRIGGCKRWNYGTICSMHRERIRLTGSAGTIEARHELPTDHYRTAHARLARLQGKASEYRCVGCGGAAEEWSYEGGAPDEQTQDWVLPQGTPAVVRFSNDPDYYQPRCRSCHVTFDKSGLRKSVSYSCDEFAG